MTTKITHVFIYDPASPTPVPTQVLCGRPTQDGDVALLDYPNFDGGRRAAPLGSRICRGCGRTLSQYHVREGVSVLDLFVEIPPATA